MKHYFAIYKAYGILSQFTQDQPGQKTLADVYDFPTDVYPVGRLDRDSEGLLLLTNDKTWHTQLLHPEKKVWKSYLVQVEGQPTDEDLKPIREGMELRIRKKDVQTLPGRAKCIAPPQLEKRIPPIRYRQSIPDSWLRIDIQEGKYRQVRKSCAHIGHPVLRLVRWSVGDYTLPSAAIGAVYKLHDTSFSRMN